MPRQQQSSNMRFRTRATEGCLSGADHRGARFFECYGALQYFPSGFLPKSPQISESPLHSHPSQFSKVSPPEVFPPNVVQGSAGPAQRFVARPGLINITSTDLVAGGRLYIGDLLRPVTSLCINPITERGPAENEMQHSPENSAGGGETLNDFETRTL